MSVPTNLIPTRITQLPLDPSPSGDGWMMYVNNGDTYRVQVANLLEISGVPPSRQVLAGTGLDGGGTLASDVTLGIANGGVGATQLDATGVTPGTYGTSSAVPMLNIDANGRIASAYDVPISIDIANQVTGILSLTNGGTGSNLPIVEGAIVWCDVDGLHVGPAGQPGQVLASGGGSEYTWLTAQVYPDQPANYVLAGPTSGADATSAFRLLVNADVPTALSGKTIDNSVIGGTTPAAGTFTSVDTQYIDFDAALGTAPAPQAGRVYYDNADSAQTLAFQMNGSTVQRIGEDQFYRVKCQGTITLGDVVMFAGTVGASGGLRGAVAAGLQPDQANYVLGIAVENGVNNQWISVLSFGEVRSIDTTGSAVGETWAQGDVLYYNPAVAGGLTNTKPSVPNAIVVVAAVVYVGSSNGIIFVRPTYGSVLGGTDGNVQFSSLANNDMIVYNGSASRWENYTPASTRTALGLGTMATQNANSVAITGGAIDNTPIGGTTAAAGTFTTVTATSYIGISGGTF